ncbi:MAG: hypothetical protein WC466_10180 [Candidatus Izemoplasmatales bacterium]
MKYNDYKYEKQKNVDEILEFLKRCNIKEEEIENTDKKLHISDVICRCKTNDACTREENGNGEWKDYCWKCKCFRSFSN